ncbi:hypothetical protein MHBO_000150 [Bonamia ostreae]|uniref:Uncharacterized protein n=1 Tax=Bonamia ostreae TaxID=126728 RepID=A0ABV2AEM8_9EUKA
MSETVLRQSNDIEAQGASIKSSKQTLNDLQTKIENDKKVIKKDIETILRFKEERNILMELISDIRIQIENSNKNIHKNNEIKETLNLEMQIIKRNLEKREYDSNLQEKTLSKLRNQILVVANEIGKAKQRNFDNAERRKFLKQKKIEIEPILNKIEMSIKEIQQKLYKIDFRKNKISKALKRLESIEELLESLQNEFNKYAEETKNKNNTNREKKTKYPKKKRRRFQKNKRSPRNLYSNFKRRSSEQNRSI